MVVTAASQFPQQLLRQEIALDRNNVPFSLSLQVLAKMREIIGFAGGDSVFAPGGSICNMYALLVARHKVDILPYASIHILIPISHFTYHQSLM